MNNHGGKYTSLSKTHGELTTANATPANKTSLGKSPHSSPNTDDGYRCTGIMGVQDHEFIIQTQGRNLRALVQTSSVPVSTFFPSVSWVDPPFDSLELKHVEVAWEIDQLDTSLGINCQVSASIIIGEEYGLIYGLLAAVGVNCSNIPVQCALGDQKEVAYQRPIIHSFLLQSELWEACYNPARAWKINSVGIRIPGYNLTSPGQSAVIPRIEVFGSMDFRIVYKPSGEHALRHTIQARYDGTQLAKGLLLSASSVSDWVNAFGLKNIVLNDFTFSTSLVPHRHHQCDFYLSCYLKIAPASPAITLEGLLSPDGDMVLAAEINEFTWGFVDLIYQRISGGKLETCDCSITGSPTSLTITSTLTYIKASSGIAFTFDRYEYFGQFTQESRLEMTMNEAVIVAPVEDFLCWGHTFPEAHLYVWLTPLASTRHTNARDDVAQGFLRLLVCSHDPQITDGSMDFQLWEDPSGMPVYVCHWQWNVLG